MRVPWAMHLVVLLLLFNTEVGPRCTVRNLSFVEAFAGDAAITRCARDFGLCGHSHDVRYHEKIMDVLANGFLCGPQKSQKHVSVYCTCL